MMKVTLFSFFYLIPSFLFTQNIIFTVTTHDSGEPLPHAYIVNLSADESTSADEYGVGSLRAKSGDTIRVSYVGYRDTMFPVTNDIAHYVIELSPQILDEIVIFSEEPFNRKAALGRHDVAMEFLTAIPSLSGDADIMKTITFLPGVTEGREGYSHLFVRGGDQDQNLILYDGATLFNVNHFGGFISMFHSQMIGSVDFYKSYWPSRFGGRLSSVLDIRSGHGNFKKHEQSIDLGLIYSKVRVTGPLWEDRISYALGARRTFIDMVTGPLIRKSRKGEGPAALPNIKVGDFNARVDGRISDDQHVSLSYFHGMDDLEYFSREFGSSINGEYIIRNNVVALNYSWYSSAFTTLRAHASFSAYEHFFDDQNIEVTRIYGSSSSLYEKNIFNRHSGNTIRSLKTSVFGNSIIDRSLELEYGLEYENIDYSIFLDRSHQFQTGGIISSVDSFSGRVDKSPSQKFTSFIDGLYHITPKWRIKGGIRVPYLVYGDYRSWLPEPKIAVIYDLTSNSTVNLAFNLQQQSTVLLGYTNIDGYFREYYTTSDNALQPSISLQWSAGYFRTFDRWIDNISLEIFYKDQKRLSKFIPGTDPDGAVIHYDQFLHHEGHNKSYGIEFLLQKTAGSFHASATYTFSRSRISFPSLNDGRPFYADFDFTHNANVLLMYEFGNKYKLAGSWNYKSGRPFTLANGISPENSITAYGYAVISDLNNSRMPPYHRLDLSLDREWLTKGKGKKQWFGISVYNAYNRVNPFYVTPENNDKLKVYGLFPIIPSFHFGFEL